LKTCQKALRFKTLKLARAKNDKIRRLYRPDFGFEPVFGTNPGAKDG